MAVFIWYCQFILLSIFIISHFYSLIPSQIKGNEEGNLTTINRYKDTTELFRIKFIKEE